VLHLDNPTTWVSLSETDLSVSERRCYLQHIVSQRSVPIHTQSREVPEQILGREFFANGHRRIDATLSTRQQRNRWVHRREGRMNRVHSSPPIVLKPSLKPNRS
jgi:hypothetical protein